MSAATHRWRALHLDELFQDLSYRDARGGPDRCSRGLTLRVTTRKDGSSALQMEVVRQILVLNRPDRAIAYHDRWDKPQSLNPERSLGSSELRSRKLGVAPEVAEGEAAGAAVRTTADIAVAQIFALEQIL
ncbi:hypothetical protein Pflav_019030 [Phytohabitans flavus]|uniref:Uncharacterized protein n=1 Tax=Phytohabitans flavus TaxID=1076124 RepID=A0A6F8XNU5_9ACTN|nr:hypothetical protein Pflav_019030 [Phytohabitans flavus]